ncbi:GNAT family N-acetyltransferase [Flavobacterium restrictum]|uniref:GNAT family N-acetyltransferase n=1 Tax=Flavobacterium restrictum TaxID=2594428 RepID=A0A553EB41_9FLAO|nr:GNAT family N-acetyltransferase [Flavobacterium restrictum]TRX42151.1 GNAT family N-acetyltransferase [Flavobacterium restrictum]
MKKYWVQQYHINHYEQWNAFIGQAKNATFLLHRDFMEYHNDRFVDHSLLVYENEKLVAVLPANKVENTVYSHQGLTYGGLIYTEKIKLTTVIQILKAVLIHLEENAIATLYVKTIPSLYHQKPAEELLYVLFVAKAQLVRRDSLSVLDLKQPNAISKIRKRGIQKGISNKLQVKEVTDFDLFWNQILLPNLALKHHTKPVHSLPEITKLKNLFPNNIRQFNVYQNDIIVAGTTIFETETAAHCQYISKAANDENLGGLDLLFAHLIANEFKNKRFFDFGISNEDQGQKLNEGLSYWKESFGASTLVQDCYEVKTANYSALETVLI